MDLSDFNLDEAREINGFRRSILVLDDKKREKRAELKAALEGWMYWKNLLISGGRHIGV